MSANVYAIDNTTNTHYGAGSTTFADFDNLVCELLGVEPDPVKFKYGWMDGFGYMIAMNATRQEVTDHIAKHLARWRKEGENMDDQERFYQLLLSDRFTWLNNWGRETNWKKPKQSKRA